MKGAWKNPFGVPPQYHSKEPLREPDRTFCSKCVQLSRDGGEPAESASGEPVHGNHIVWLTSIRQSTGTVHDPMISSCTYNHTMRRGRFRLCRPWSGRKTTGLDQGWQQRSTPCACITGINSYLSSPCVMQTCVVPSIPGFRRIVTTYWPSPFGILASLARLIIQLISTTKSHWCRQGYSPVWRGDPSGTRRGRQPINS